jgi:hypothetical protein
VDENFIILAPLHQDAYMLFEQTDRQDSTLPPMRNRRFTFVKPIDQQLTPELYFVAHHADALRKRRKTSDNEG